MMVFRKKMFTFMLMFVIMITSVIPASASSNAADKDKIGKGTLVYTSDIGNKVYKENTSKDIFIVISEPVSFNKLQDDGTTVPAKRTYFQFANSLDEAKKVADDDPEEVVTGENVALAKWNFWNGSWIDDIWDFWYGDGWGIYLSPVDAAYVKDLGGVAAATIVSGILAYAKVPASYITGISGIVGVAVATFFHEVSSPDQSISLKMYKANLVQGLACLSTNLYLGQASAKGQFREYFWAATALCL